MHSKINGVLSVSKNLNTTEIQSPDTQRNKKEKKPKRKITIEDREKDVVLLISAFTLAISTIPHFMGFAISPKGFIGSPYNVDDYLVYLSWLYQTSHGHIFLQNLFTTDRQSTLLFNLLYSVMGLVKMATHLSGPMVLELMRLVGAAGLLAMIYRFYKVCMPNDRAARLTAYGFSCLGSGIGWISWRLWQDKNFIYPNTPIDAWQPEAYTFLSLYLSALFSISTIFIIATIYNLYLSVKTNQIRYAIYGGICGFILGNIHTYDILHVIAAWGLFLVLWTLMHRGKGVARIWGYSIIAFLITLPSVLYVYWVLMTNPIFRARAQVATLSDPIMHYLTGYGLVSALAIAAFVIMLWLNYSQKASNQDNENIPFNTGWSDKTAQLLVFAWAIAGISVIYIPVDFQRKMVMGEHIPLCLVAGWGIAWLTRKIPRMPRGVLLTILVFATFPSNAFFIRRDLIHIRHNVSETNQWPVVTPDQLRALQFLDRYTPKDAAILAIPSEAAYIPGMIGRRVWAGHWGETPHISLKYGLFTTFTDPNTSDEERIQFLKDTKTQYFMYPKDIEKANDAKMQTRFMRDFYHNRPSYLGLIYDNRTYAIYRILIPNVNKGQ